MACRGYKGKVWEPQLWPIQEWAGRSSFAADDSGITGQSTTTTEGSAVVSRASRGEEEDPVASEEEDVEQQSKVGRPV